MYLAGDDDDDDDDDDDNDDLDIEEVGHKDELKQDILLHLNFIFTTEYKQHLQSSLAIN